MWCGCGVNAPEIGLDHFFNALLVMDLVSHLIPKGQNFVPPSFVDGESVEESSIGIHTIKPVYSSFEFPEVLLTSEDI